MWSILATSTVEQVFAIYIQAPIPDLSSRKSIAWTAPKLRASVTTESISGFNGNRSSRRQLRSDSGYPCPPVTGFIGCTEYSLWFEAEAGERKLISIDRIRNY